MNTSLPHSTSEAYIPNSGASRQTSRSTVSWGAIFAGTSAAIAMYVLYMMLAAGLGLAIYNPVTSDNPVASFSVGALVIHSVGAIISLCLGGAVAGHFTSVRTRSTAWLHGFSVWCAATVIGVVMVTLGAGWMISGLSSLAGGGVSAAGQTVGGVADLAGEAIKQSGDTIESFVDEAVSRMSDDAPEYEGIRAKREIGFALARLFNPMQESNTAINREAAVTALADHTEMSQSEAERAVVEWTDSYERLQADLAEVTTAAEAKAREAADSTADALAKVSLWGFVGFLIGALGAAFGGTLGAKCATKCEEKHDGNVYVPAQNA